MKGRARGRQRSGLRLFLLAVLLLGASGWGAWRLLEQAPSSRVECLLASQPLELLLHAERRTLAAGETVPVGGVVLTGDAQISALRYAGSSFRLSRDTKLRVVRATPLWFTGVTVSLERGRVWVRRGESTPVTLLVPGHEVRLGVGDADVSLDGSGRPRVWCWSASAEILGRDGTVVLRLAEGQSAVRKGDAWAREALGEAGHDRWVAWNQAHTDVHLRSGQVEPYAAPAAAPRPSPTRPAPVAVVARSTPAPAPVPSSYPTRRPGARAPKEAPAAERLAQRQAEEPPPQPLHTPEPPVEPDAGGIPGKLEIVEERLRTPGSGGSVRMEVTVSNTGTEGSVQGTVTCNVKDGNWAVRWTDSETANVGPGESRTLTFYMPFSSRMSIDSTSDKKFFADEYAYGVAKSAIYTVEVELTTP